jgi:hypothetical protein
MDNNALMSAMKEKEMISLITELFKYRQSKGREKFLEVVSQMRTLLEVNNNPLDLSILEGKQEVNLK